MKTKINFSFLLWLILPTFLFNSCSVYKAMKEYNTQENNLYEGSVFLSNGEKQTGRVAFPNYESETVLFFDASGTRSEIKREDIEHLVLYNSSAPDIVYSVHFLPIRKTGKRWVVKTAEGEYLTSYIGAAGYKILSDGTLELGGYRQHISTGNGTAVVNPSFPVLMQKKGETELTMVGLKGGVNMESSGLRSGFSRFLKDDPQLTQYIRDAKWGYDNLGEIVEYYIPNRTEDQKLALAELAPVPVKFFTDDLTHEIIVHAETGFPIDKDHGTMFGIGFKFVPYKFFTWDFGVGYTTADVVSYDKRMENHLINGLYTAPVIPEDYITEKCVNFNIFAGGQLPMDLKKIYLIPSAGVNFGASIFTNNISFNPYYGPTGMLDIGFKFKYGNILLLGCGYRHNIPIASDSKRAENAYPDYDAFKPYGTLIMRLTYKF